MNRREMLASGFRRLARALPGLATGRRLDRFTGRPGLPPPPEALSFPPKLQEPANPALNPHSKED